MARIALTYMIPGNVIVDLDTGEVVESILDIYDYSEPTYVEFDNSGIDDPEPTKEQKDAALDIVANEGLDWELG
jgi:hypothetical protein